MITLDIYLSTDGKSTVKVTSDSSVGTVDAQEAYNVAKSAYALILADTDVYKISDKAVAAKTQPMWLDKKETCTNCNSPMKYSEGVSAKSGKPYKMWKCTSCDKVVWVK